MTNLTDETTTGDETQKILRVVPTYIKEVGRTVDIYVGRLNESTFIIKDKVESYKPTNDRCIGYCGFVTEDGTVCMYEEDLDSRFGHNQVRNALGMSENCAGFWINDVHHVLGVSTWLGDLKTSVSAAKYLVRCVPETNYKVALYLKGQPEIESRIEPILTMLNDGMPFETVLSRYDPDKKKFKVPRRTK